MEVQIKKIQDKKLRKDYEINIPHSLISSKIEEQAKKLQPKVNIKGFRKGQVPTKIILEKYSQSIMADESDKLISKQIKKIIDENNYKIALQPKIEIKTFEKDKDIEISATFEIFPEVPEIDLKKIKITKKQAKISEKDVEEGIEKMLKYFKTWQEQDPSYKAKIGDAVNIDYVGKVDKEEFEGGKAQSYQLELGSKSFIDDFEEQLVGKKAGDEVKVKVKFPKEYHSQNMAGKKAEFDVKINKVLTSSLPEINDEFIKTNFGLESLEKLKEAIEKQISQNYENLSKDAFKKELFDFLNKKYDFDLPEGLIEQQFQSLWSETEEELKENPEKFKNDKEKEKAKDEKRKIAQRMIRCGIILNDLSIKNKIEPSNEDINNELQKIMQRFAGQEQQVIEYYQKNQNAISQLKGTIIEEKTVDFIIKNAEIEIKEFSLKDFDKMLEKLNQE